MVGGKAGRVLDAIKGIQPPRLGWAERQILVSCMHTDRTGQLLLPFTRCSQNPR